MRRWVVGLAARPLVLCVVVLPVLFAFVLLVLFAGLPLVLFAIVFTYSGFALLAVAVGWNANIVQKLKGMRTKWRALRGRASQ